MRGGGVANGQDSVVLLRGEAEMTCGASCQYGTRLLACHADDYVSGLVEVAPGGCRFQHEHVLDWVIVNWYVFGKPWM